MSILLARPRLWLFLLPFLLIMLSDILAINELLKDDDFSLQSIQVQNILRIASAVLKWAKQPEFYDELTQFLQSI